MARAEINEVVLVGNPVRLGVGASVTVSRRDGGSATVHSSENGTGTLTNPLTADGQGRINGWLEEGSYTLSVVRGSQSYSQPFEAIVVRSSGSATSDAVSVGTSSTLIVDANDERSELSIWNDTVTTTLYLGLGEAAVVGRGPVVYSGGIPYTTSTFTGAIYGISTATTNATFAEV